MKTCKWGILVLLRLEYNLNPHFFQLQGRDHYFNQDPWFNHHVYLSMWVIAWKQNRPHIVMDLYVFYMIYILQVGINTHVLRPITLVTILVEAPVPWM